MQAPTKSVTVAELAVVADGPFVFARRALGDHDLTVQVVECLEVAVLAGIGPVGQLYVDHTVHEAACAGSATMPMIKPADAATSPIVMILLAFMVSDFFPWLSAVE
jgi:hypothetical protein